MKVLEWYYGQGLTVLHSGDINRLSDNICFETRKLAVGEWKAKCLKVKHCGHLPCPCFVLAEMKVNLRTLDKKEDTNVG